MRKLIPLLLVFALALCGLAAAGDFTDAARELPWRDVDLEPAEVDEVKSIDAIKAKRDELVAEVIKIQGDVSKRLETLYASAKRRACAKCPAGEACPERIERTLRDGTGGPTKWHLVVGALPPDPNALRAPRGR